ncbi:hypothetical protein FVE85_8178 [Porphyridium purpureum]|uniref:Uncharacterized protein n=1 Tax=Porphyridium purpureum TaxID=35688 RepID=A0A5J4YMF6_PORPP|nr:hypothetical protein FVE85_8178 [Porphyridium purpureum]|eukprot:POR5928..scf295_9
MGSVRAMPDGMHRRHEQHVHAGKAPAPSHARPPRESHNAQFFAELRAQLRFMQQHSNELREAALKPGAAGSDALMALSLAAYHASEEGENQVQNVSIDQRCELRATQMRTELESARAQVLRMKHVMDDPKQAPAAELIHACRATIVHQNAILLAVEDTLAIHGYKRRPAAASVRTKALADQCDLNETTSHAPDASAGAETGTRGKPTVAGETPSRSRHHAHKVAAGDDDAAVARNGTTQTSSRMAETALSTATVDERARPAQVTPNAHSGCDRVEKASGDADDSSDDSDWNTVNRNGAARRDSSDFHTPNTPTLEDFGLNAAHIEKAKRKVAAFRYAAITPTPAKRPIASAKGYEAADSTVHSVATKGVGSARTPMFCAVSPGACASSDDESFASPVVNFTGRTGQYFIDNNSSGSSVLNAVQTVRQTEPLSSPPARCVSHTQTQIATTTGKPVIAVPRAKVQTDIETKPDATPTLLVDAGMYATLPSFIQTQVPHNVLSDTLERLLRDERLQAQDWISQSDLEKATQLPHNPAKAAILALTKLKRLQYLRRGSDMGYLLVKQSDHQAN